MANLRKIFENDPNDLYLCTVAKDYDTGKLYIVSEDPKDKNKQIWKEFNAFYIEPLGFTFNNVFFNKMEDFPNFFISLISTKDIEGFGDKEGDFLNPFANMFSVFSDPKRGYVISWEISTTTTGGVTNLLRIEYPINDFYEYNRTASLSLVERRLIWEKENKINWLTLIANQLKLKNPDRLTNEKADSLAGYVWEGQKNCATIIDRYIKTYFSNKEPSMPDKNKLQIGDRVEIPLTKKGKEVQTGTSIAIDTAKNKKQKYLYVTDTFYGTSTPNEILLNSENDDTGDYFRIDLDNLIRIPDSRPKTFNYNEGKNELYIVQNDRSEMLYATLGNTKYFKPSVVLPSVIVFHNTDIAEETYNITTSVGLVYDKSVISTANDGIGFIVENFNNKTKPFDTTKLTNLKEITDTVKRIYDYLRTNASLRYATEFNDQMTLVIEAIKQGLITFPKEKSDCEADPSKIVSGTVKKFYETNKSRIDKLNPKIMCKIIQALVSLSEYEDCGVGSSDTLPKAKSDLLSRISKLKI